MYRPHAATKDSILFPAFHQLVGEAAFREPGEEFEDKEHQLLGDQGFERAVTPLGRHDLATFTPLLLTGGSARAPIPSALDRYPTPFVAAQKQLTPSVLVLDVNRRVLLFLRSALEPYHDANAGCRA